MRPRHLGHPGLLGHPAAAATTAALLLVAGCGGPATVSAGDARDGVRSGLARIDTALRAGRGGDTDTHTATTAVTDGACGDGGQRWQGVVAFALPTGTGLANAAAQADGMLEAAGWDTKAAAGSAAQGVLLLPVTAGGKNAGQVAGELSITEAQDSLQYVATLRSGCVAD